jgi:two-component system chemotaxis response regulator CheB
VQTVLRTLGIDFPLPILVVQHITRGYTEGLAAWLKLTVPLPVQLATQTVALQPGHVYLAPDDQHLLVQSRGFATLRPIAPADSFCPSADVLFTAVATVYKNRALGVVLTGMGDDGVRGLQALAAAGSPTLAQDEASCVVYGMPRAAVAAGAITRVAPLNELGAIIREFAQCSPMLATATTGTP